VKTEVKVSLNTSAFSSPVVTSLLVLLIRGYAFFDFPFLDDIPVEVLLVILCIPCQVQLQLRLGPPDPIPTQLSSIPVLFPAYLSLLPVPVQFPLAL